MSASLPTVADIEAAALRIAPHIVRTPLLENADLNDRVGARVFLKPETLQRTGSFKFRGAVNAILQIPAEKRSAGVVAFSSGNHAQGVAAAAKTFGLPATIVMPRDAPAAKIDGTKRRGAEVIFYDRMTDDREAIAREIVERSGATLIPPFDGAEVIAGQGTVGLEIAADAPEMPAAVLVPCGGGGLVSGIGVALSKHAPSARVIATEPERFDGMRVSLAAGARRRAEGGPLSIADALMAPMPGALPFALAQRYVAETLTVTDADLQAGMVFAAQHLKLVVEPGGAAALAALLMRKFHPEGRAVAVVLSGGNCDIATLSRAAVTVP